MWEHKLNDVKVIESVHLGSDRRFLIDDLLIGIETPIVAKGWKYANIWSEKKKKLRKSLKYKL